MKKVYLIHGWGGSDSSEGWFGWLKQEMKKRNITLTVFNMPNTQYPKIDEWVGFLEKNIKNADKDTYLIGHSIGCQTILRYLEKLPGKTKIAGCIFVAGWFNLIMSNIEAEGGESVKIVKPWIETPINLNKVKEHTDNFLAIFSDNDDFVPTSDEKLFKERLNAKTIMKHNQVHFNGTKEIKEILEFVK